MATWRFFKKHEPTNSPVLSNGAKVQFTSLDTIVGYFGTDNAYIQSEFDRMTAERRGGLTEISQDEFHRDYVQKKSSSKVVQPPWREELGKSQVNRSLLHQLGPDRVAAAADVNEAKVSVAQPSATVALPVSEKPDGYVPSVGKRLPRKSK